MTVRIGDQRPEALTAAATEPLVAWYHDDSGTELCPSTHLEVSRLLTSLKGRPQSYDWLSLDFCMLVASPINVTTARRL